MTVYKTVSDLRVRNVDMFSDDLLEAVVKLRRQVSCVELVTEKEKLKKRKLQLWKKLKHVELNTGNVQLLVDLTDY